MILLYKKIANLKNSKEKPLPTSSFFFSLEEIHFACKCYQGTTENPLQFKLGKPFGTVATTPPLQPPWSILQNLGKTTAFWSYTLWRPWLIKRENHYKYWINSSFFTNCNSTQGLSDPKRILSWLSYVIGSLQWLNNIVAIIEFLYYICAFKTGF